MKIKLTVSYDGTNYCGWQVQPNGITVQQVLEDALFLATGERSLIIAMKVLKNLEEQGKTFDIINARFVKPLDLETLQNLQSEYIVTIEDNVLLGGFGSLVNNEIIRMQKPCKVKNFAYRDEFIPQGTIADLQRDYGVSCQEIQSYIADIL